MKNDLSKQQLDTILKALNDMVDEGPWDSSQFLHEVGKKIANIRDLFLAPIKSYASAELKNQSIGRADHLVDDQNQEVYISLYSADGMNFASWERILSNLPKQMISRSIYADENDIKAAIAMKDNKTNEAYVSLCVNKSSILTIDSNKQLVDKLGKPLLTLKDRIITLDSLGRFVHSTGEYLFKNGRLVKNEPLS